MHRKDERRSAVAFFFLLKFLTKGTDDNADISRSEAAKYFSDNGHLSLRFMKQRNSVCPHLTSSRGKMSGQRQKWNGKEQVSALVFSPSVHVLWLSLYLKTSIPN